MERCRCCGGVLEKVLDFGRMPLADRFVTPDEVADEYFFDLTVGMCTGCAMVQLINVPEPELIFRSDYPYRSSGSIRMAEHFAATARTLAARELTGQDPFVVELGSNDGVMLRVLAEEGIRHLGVEPSAGLVELSARRGVRSVAAFFDHDLALRIRADHGRANLIYAANTMCHIADIGSVLSGIDALLTDDGALVFEDPYLGDILRGTAFDQIYDEHVFYFTLRSAQRMLAPHGLEVSHVEPLDVHGGELRYTVTRRGRRPVDTTVTSLLAAEDDAELTDPAALASFRRRVEETRERLPTLLRELRSAGRRVVGYGATAKSATVTNYCGITPELIEFVCDSTPAKQGRLTPGAHLPVVAPETFSAHYPDHAVLFAWNHATEIIGNESAFAAGGGQWIVYVPEVRMIAG